MPQNIHKLEIWQKSLMADMKMGMLFDPFVPEQLSLLEHHDKTLQLESLITGDPVTTGISYSIGHFQSVRMYGTSISHHQALMGYFESKGMFSYPPEPLTIQLKLSLRITPTFKESMQAHKKFYLNKIKRVFRG